MGDKRKARSLPTSLDVYSVVHKGKPCTACILCNEKQTQYTYPASWKNKEAITQLRRLEPNKVISAESCICRNCRDSLNTVLKTPGNFQPRWRRESKVIDKCQVKQCTEKASRSTNITNRDRINEILTLSPVRPGVHSPHTHSCDTHYRSLHRQLNPLSYNYKCATCGISLQSSSRSTFRHCPNSTLVQEHLRKHTEFEENISPTAKVCDSCYRAQLEIIKVHEQTVPTFSDDSEYNLLVNKCQEAVPPLPFPIKSKDDLIELAIQITIVKVAQELKANHALTLLSAYNIFTEQVQSLVQMSTLTTTPALPSHRWLLSKLASSLQHHLIYTCQVKKHGIILCRRGKELTALSYALYESKKSQQTLNANNISDHDTHTHFYSDLHKRLQHRMKQLDRFKTEILHISEQKDVHPTLPSILTTDHRTKKQEQNIIKVMTKVKELLPNLDQTSSNRGLINIFSERVANSAQRHDLLNFRSIGQTAFENRINAYILKVPSTTAPKRKKKLQTFSSTKTKGNNKLKSLKQEMLRVQKCIRRKIAFANKTGTMPDVIGEQYIEQPRALCNENSVPLKGQKSSVTKFYQSRYKGSTLITHTLNSDWVPDSVIIEGMFIINTKPLTSHKTMASYGAFWIRRFILPHFLRGSTQVHVLFDNPGQLEENPKVFEQARRDSACTSVEHSCWILFDEAEVPKKWSDILKCRQCKRSLTKFLSAFFVKRIKPSLNNTQSFVTAGAMENDSDEAILVSKDLGPHPYPLLRSNAEESDIRIWLHVKHSAGFKVLIQSPDTDTYHVGLPFVTPQMEVVVQLSNPGDRHLRLLHLHTLVDLLNRDPELTALNTEHRTWIMQCLYVCTGCDYVSFFAGIGKTTFLKAFFEKATFIAGDQSRALSVTTFRDISEGGFLAFIKLVGIAYFKKHSRAFGDNTAEALFHVYTGLPPQEQHEKWLHNIRQTIWDRISFEDEMIPSLEALQRHWMRSSWVLHMWRQAQTTGTMALVPLVGNGWLKDDNGKLVIDWDSEDNMKKVRSRVNLVLKGCSCKSGCTTNRCGCRKKEIPCGVGCSCKACLNQEERNMDSVEESNSSSDESDTDLEQDNYNLETHVDEIMTEVFGQWEADDDSSEESND